MSAHGQHSGVCSVTTPCHVSRCTATTAAAGGARGSKDCVHAAAAVRGRDLHGSYSGASRRCPINREAALRLPGRSTSGQRVSLELQGRGVQAAS